MKWEVDRFRKLLGEMRVLLTCFDRLAEEAEKLELKVEVKSQKKPVHLTGEAKEIRDKDICDARASGMKIEEIAEAFGVRPSTVQSITARRQSNLMQNRVLRMTK